MLPGACCTAVVVVVVVEVVVVVVMVVAVMSVAVVVPLRQPRDKNRVFKVDTIIVTTSIKAPL